MLTDISKYLIKFFFIKILIKINIRRFMFLLGQYFTQKVKLHNKLYKLI